MSKKILFIVTQSEFGGAQHFLAHFTTALDKNKYEISIAAGPEGDDETGLLKFLEKKGINTKHLKHLRRGINPLFDLWAVVEIFKLVKKEKPNVLFLCSSKAGLIGAFAGRLAGVSKIVYRIGGWAFNDPRPQWEKAFYKLIEKISARWKDIIIVNAECHRKQAVELGIKPRKKMVTIYNGIDIGKLKFLSRNEARKKLSDKVTSYMIGTIANFYPAKGLDYLIESANILVKKYPKLIFIVIGDGGEREKLENLIKKYNLEKNFFLIGIIPDAYKYLKAFDIFVLPSVKEGFPWTILETMASGIPIVTTKVGAIPEVIENKKTGLLVRPGNVKELSEAIVELISNKSLGVKLPNQAKRVVKEKFSLEKMVKKIEALL